ncbi:putative epimerase, PhzC/PhzF [Cryptosporangium arvum DSM 44712]|uniref:Putative epimerase, PhzC/PhzF n=2 Tax=Cryptosporangium TaxID=65502 RepID=A0A010ZTC2_9ACTN|nr:putative epimerase, PhzC/PhzF [Cryptosporangium arvum DSM 44712]
MLSGMSIEVHELLVFPGPDGTAGNPLGVVLDGASVLRADRQGVAAELGYSETVFVDDAATGAITIFTPAVELPFAGHPTVGTAWLLAREKAPVDALRPPAGTVAVRYETDLTWVTARPEWTPKFDFRQLGSAAEVENYPLPTEGQQYVWAWIDEAAGIVRSRSFPVDMGIQEDEATGAAAVALVGKLGRRVEIHQGVGSVLIAGPTGDGAVELGGRTTAVRRLELAR